MMHPPRRTPQRPVTRFALLFLAAALMLAGCSVEAIRPGDNTAAAESAQTQTPDAEPTAEESDDPLWQARRSSYVDQIDVTIGCPSGEVVLDQDDQTTLITESCEKVTVKAEYAEVLAEHVGTLIVDLGGDDSTVLVRSVDTVNVYADYVVIYWDEGSPGVKVTGLESVANPNPVKER